MQATQPIRAIYFPKAALTAILTAVAIIAIVLAVAFVAPSLRGVGATEAGSGLAEFRAGERALTTSGSGLAQQRAGEIGLGAAPVIEHGPSGVAPQPGARGRLAQ